MDYGAILTGVVGAASGSFINVCAYRVPRGISIVRPRSFCPSCGAQLRWHELVPLLSHIILGGRCAHCRARISLEYPAFEMLSSAIAVLLFIRCGLGLEWFYWFTLSMVLILVALIDRSHLLIPNKVLLVGLVSVAALKAATIGAGVVEDLLLAAIFMGLAYVFVVGVSILLNKQAMGMGDVKLIGLLAFALGWKEAALVIWLAALLGVGYSTLKRLGQSKTVDLRIPFGTMLGAAALAVIGLGSNITSSVLPWLILNPYR